MTTSGNIFPQRLSKIDELTRSDHYYLEADDDCFYIGEYTARGGYGYSATNNLILNFKKEMDRQGQPEWPYKQQAILKAAQAFSLALGDDGLDGYTFVPVPPSKARDDPMYDDRLIKMLDTMRQQPPVDVREIISQTQNTESAARSGIRLRPDEIEALYSLDETLVGSPIKKIAIVDDVLTTGAHFKAAKSILTARFPEVPILGLFIARRNPGTPEIEDLQF